jgi:ABC-type Fe3+/spermidine/putrescine transport system ATPase subunit
MVFQSFNLFGHLTVLQNLMLAPVKVRGVSRAKATCARAARPRRTRGQGRLVPRPAVRRPAAARCHRPRAGDGPEGAAVRRTHFRA